MRRKVQSQLEAADGRGGFTGFTAPVASSSSSSSSSVAAPAAPGSVAPAAPTSAPAVGASLGDGSARALLAHLERRERRGLPVHPIPLFDMWAMLSAFAARGVPRGGFGRNRPSEGPVGQAHAAWLAKKQVAGRTTLRRVSGCHKGARMGCSSFPALPAHARTPFFLPRPIGQ